MFGYVRPLREELKCRDFDLYRATYCGLCRAMRRRYGWLAPMFLNYDFTFLALLLAPAEERFTPCRGRCHANPLIKKPMCQTAPGLETAADESVVLTWWQLRDKAEDEGFLPGLTARLLAILLKPSYRKAARRQPEFDRLVRECLEQLHRMEEEKIPSLDRPAHTFALLLQGAAPKTGEEGRDRAMEQMLYHLGRWIYLLDAQDDLEEDLAQGRYNPVAARFGPEGDGEAMKRTLDHSRNLMCGAAQLMEFGCRWPVIENILYFGLPLVQRAVLDGSWKQIKNQRIWRHHT